MTNHTIVVGVDGSNTSLTAARWAAQDAARRNLSVHALLAYEWAWHGARFTGEPRAETEARQHADDAVQAAVAAISDAAPGIQVTGTAVRGHPAEVLIDAGATADQIVLGNRGVGGFTSLLLGSVSLQVATHASCPVVVVPGGLDAFPGTGPVIVGVDGSSRDEYTVRLGFDAAASRGCNLIVVHAYDLPLVWSGYGITPRVYNEPEFTEQPRKLVDEAVHAWREKYPAVPVETLVAKGSATQVLIGVSKTAQLVVVGSRGHGGFSGLLLGSVGQQLLHFSHSPVLVARSPEPR